MEILRNLDNIDFRVLMSGKICYDECARVKKLARLDCIQMPAFMRNQEKYKKTLKQIAHMNGLHLDHAKFKAPMAYLRRLKRGRRIGVAGGSKKVRKKGKRASLNKGVGSGGTEGSFGNLGSDSDDGESGQESGGEDRFYFEHYTLASEREREIFQSIKKNMEKNGIRSDSLFNHNYNNFYKSIVENYETLKHENKKDDENDSVVNVEVKSENSAAPEVKKSILDNRDWENDCVKTQYGCVSRATVQLMMNLPSKSLNSRTRNLSLDEVKPPPLASIQRPLSSFIPRRASQDREGTDLSNNSQVQAFPFAQNSSPLAQHTLPSTDLNHHTGHVKPVCSTESSTATTESITVTNESSTAPSKFPAQKSISETNMVKGEKNFIYPGETDDDIADDVIKLSKNYSLRTPEPDLANSLLPLSGSKGGQRLLNRRVKSAANLLPKCSDAN